MTKISNVIIVGLCFIYLMMVLSVPRGELSDLEKTKMWKVKDIYLIYRMLSDEEYRSVGDEELVKEINKTFFIGKEMINAIYKRGS